MIKQIIFSATLLFSINVSLHSMNMAHQDNLDFFTICTNDADLYQGKNLNLQLRRIDLHNLLDPKTEQEKLDRQSFMDILCDYEANKNAYGTEVAEFLKPTSSDKMLSDWIQGQDNKLSKMPDDQKFMHHWIIEDSDNNHAFVGRMCVHTYIGQRPNDYEDTFMVAFGLTIASSHRNQKIFSRIAQPTLIKISKLIEEYALTEHEQTMTHRLGLCTLDEELCKIDVCNVDNEESRKKCNNFLNIIFCFDTDTDNHVMHLAAEKIGATKIHSWTREINICGEKMMRKSDLFAILWLL